jgi:hypothetical protein
MRENTAFRVASRPITSSILPQKDVNRKVSDRTAHSFFQDSWRVLQLFLHKCATANIEKTRVTITKIENAIENKKLLIPMFCRFALVATITYKTKINGVTEEMSKSCF